ncbi:hypothetical protein BKA62DRAFT_826144 [Auriculariales sp. MPI-PUGE-AT-0066]|nr:hypothetical protein BKA62DRAFT_826144 [Auriculariales sp. MPI-PUGE-AT-0066]
MALVLEYIIRQGKSNWKQTVGAPEEEEAHLLESMHEEDLHGGPDLDEISLQLHSPPDSPPRLSTRRVRWADDEGLDDTYIDERPSRPIPRLSGDSGISMSFESFDSMRLAISRNSTFIKRKPVPTISSQDLAVTEVKRAHWTTLFDEKNLTLDSPEAQQTRTHASSAPSRNGRTHGRKRSITLCGPSLLAGSPTNSTWMPVGGVASGTAPVVITTTTSADVGQARASDEEHTSE